MDTDVVYKRRESVLTSGETEWRANDEGLTRRDPDGNEVALKWSDVHFVQVRYNPTSLKRWLHMTRIVSTNALMVLDNSHFVGFGDFEDRSATYTPLMRKALERIAVAAPNADIRVGSDSTAYVAQILLILVAFSALAFVILTLPVPVPLTFSISVKLLIIATGLPFLWRWIKTNRPRKKTALEAIADLPPAPDTIAQPAD